MASPPQQLPIYGVSLKIQNIAQIVVHSVDNALIPIIAHNYGAKKNQRIKETIRWAFAITTVVMTIILSSMELIPAKILLLFNASNNMMEIGIPAIRLLTISFFAGAFNIVFAAIYQGFGNGKFSMYLVFVRQLAFLISLLLVAAYTK